MITRIPPHNIDAEQAVLGSMLQDKEAIEKADEILNSDGGSFYHDIHGKIYKVMIDLYRSNIPVDLITCSEEFKDTKILDPLGGESYLAVLLEVVPTTANVAWHINIVKEKAGLRKIISSCTDIASKSYDSEELDSVIDAFQEASLNVETTSISNYESIEDISLELLKKLKEGVDTGVKTGMSALDELTGGCQRGDLIIMAGRPSMGKTSFAMDIAYRQASAGCRVGVFPIETGKEDITKNAIARLTEINSLKFRTNELTDYDWSVIEEKTKEFHSLPLYIDDKSKYIEDIISACRRLKKDKGLDIIFIDYLGLVGTRSGAESKNHELGIITKRLKFIAKELDIPVVLLSQLSRKLESREDKRPILSDLRDSGEIEQDADLVIMLYREDYYKKEKTERDRKGITEIIVNKHRNGPTGDMDMLFKKQFLKFEDVEGEW